MSRSNAIQLAVKLVEIQNAICSILGARDSETEMIFEYSVFIDHRVEICPFKYLHV